MTNVSTTEVLAKGNKRPVKRAFSENLGEVNKGWGILSELSDNNNKFEIALKGKNRNVNMEVLEKSIVESSIHDEEVIKKIEEQNKKVTSELNKEIQTIKHADALAKESTSSAMVSSIVSDFSKVNLADLSNQVTQGQESVNTNINNSVPPAPVVVSSPLQQSVEVNTVPTSRPNAGVVSSDLKENISFMKNKSSPSKDDKNMFFSLLMRGLAQLYINETTSIFNPVVFIFKNFRALVKTLFLLGMPAILTWLLFTKVSSLTLTMATASAPMYSFYAIMFYIASLCVCLTLLVLGIGFWAVIKKTMTEVASDANTKTKLKT